MHEVRSTDLTNAAPLQRLAMFTSGLTLGSALAVLAWAIVVARL